MLRNCPEESELLLRSTCYLPERSHLILFAALAGATGPRNLDCLAVVPDWVFFCWETEVY